MTCSEFCIGNITEASAIIRHGGSLEVVVAESRLEAGWEFTRAQRLAVGW